MDSTIVTTAADVLSSVDTGTVALITGILAVFHPYITDLVSALWLDKITVEKLRKSCIFLFSTVFGIAATWAINKLGHFNLSGFMVFLIGGGLYTTVGEAAYRVRNHLTKDKTTDVESGQSG